jgi:hypothetical protein
MVANLARVGWNLSVVLICTSFMTKGVEHSFMHLLVISSSLKYLIHLPIYKLDYFSFAV